MQCHDVMKMCVHTCRPRDTAARAARIMRDRNVGCLPVIDEDGVLLGIVTDRDLAVRVLGEARDPEVRVEDVMTREPISCRPGDPVEVVEEKLALHHKNRIPVVDVDGRCVGVVSRTDVQRLHVPVGARA